MFTKKLGSMKTPNIEKQSAYPKRDGKTLYIRNLVRYREENSNEIVQTGGSLEEIL